MPELEIKQLTYKYRKNTHNTLDNLNCSFQSGTITAVMGISGIGKTTLLSLLAGLDQPSDGCIVFDGKQILDIDEYRRNTVSLISQNYLLFPYRTVLENVMYPLQTKSVNNNAAEQYAKELLSKVSIDEELFTRFPKNLSGGEQQRVAIARCLAANTPVIVADEPTGNLDEDNTDNIVQLLRKLAHDDNKIVIIATHDMKVALGCDIIYRLEDAKTMHRINKQ